MRTKYVLATFAAALVLAGCGGGAEAEPGPPPFEERDPHGYAACKAYMSAPSREVAAQLEDDLDLILFAGAAAHEHALESSTTEISGAVNEELTKAGVPSVIAADLIAACQDNGIEIEPGSAAEAAQRA